MCACLHVVEQGPLRPHSLLNSPLSNHYDEWLTAWSLQLFALSSPFIIATYMFICYIKSVHCWLYVCMLLVAS